MQTRREVIESLAGFALLTGSLQQQAAAGRKPVFQHDLPNVSLNGWAVTAVEVGYGPGESSNPHRHPGVTLAYSPRG